MIREFYYEFSIEIEGIEDDWADVLYEAGCDDSLVAKCGDRVFVDFCRESTSYGEAVKTAITDIEKAGGTVVDIQRIDWEEGIPNRCCLDEPVNVVEDTIERVVDAVEHFAENADAYAKTVVDAGRRIMERAKDSFTK